MIQGRIERFVAMELGVLGVGKLEISGVREKGVKIFVKNLLHLFLGRIVSASALDERASRRWLGNSPGSQERLRKPVDTLGFPGKLKKL